MRNVKTNLAGLTDKSARALARKIVKEARDVRVKFGTTNGQIVLHVYVPGGLSRTITNEAGWELHPANTRSQANRVEDTVTVNG